MKKPNQIIKYAKLAGWTVTVDHAIGKATGMESWRVKGIIKGDIDPSLYEARQIARSLGQHIDKVFPEQ